MNWKVLLLLSAGHWVTDINTGALPAFLPFIKEFLNLSYTMTAMIILTFNITSSVIQPVFGYISDRHTVKWLLPAGCFVAPLGLALIGFSPSYGWVLVFAALSGLGQASYHPEGFKTANLMSGEKKATAISIFHFGGNLGFAVAPILAIFFYHQWGLKGSALFIVPGIIMVGVFLSTSQWRAQPEPSSPKSSPLKKAAFPRKSFSGMALLLTVVVLRSASRLGIITFVPFYFMKVLNQDPMVAGQYLSAFLISGSIGVVGGGPLADRFGYKRTVLLSLGLAPVALYFFYVTSGALSFVFFAGAGFLIISSNSVTMAMGQSFMPNQIGMASALVLGLSLGIGGICTTVLGWVADNFSLPLTLKLTFLLPFVAFLILLWIPYPGRPKTDSPQ